MKQVGGRTIRERGTRVVVAHDLAGLRENLADLLRGQAEVKIVGEATNGREILEAVDTLRPDVLLLKPLMSATGGLETLSQVREKSPATKVLLLASKTDRELIFQALQRGARGYLSNTAGTAELVKAIRAVHAGEAWVERDVMGDLLGALSNGKDASSRRAEARILSEREREVASLVSTGLPNKEIAGRLGVSEKTVKSHLASIFRKLHVRHRLQLAFYPLDCWTREEEKRPGVVPIHKRPVARAKAAGATASPQTRKVIRLRHMIGTNRYP